MTTKDESTESNGAVPPIVVNHNANGELDHQVLLESHLHRFSTMTPDEKARFTDMLSKGFKALIDVNKNSEETTDRILKHKLKFWSVILLLSVAGINITALVTAILVIGVRGGTLPDIEPINSLIHFALEILKTVFAA